MAIPDDRLSIVPHPADYIPPDDYDRTLDEDKEQGPLGIGDTSEGLDYQVWHLTYSDPDFTMTPETVGAPVTDPTWPTPTGVTQCSFAFDQNANVTIAWTAAGVASLYFFNSATAQYETFASILGAISPTLCLDDKRSTQTSQSDVLLFYTKAVGETFVLHMRRQRDRYDTEFNMVLPCWQYIWKQGMHEELRLQFITTDAPPT